MLKCYFIAANENTSKLLLGPWVVAHGIEDDSDICWYHDHPALASHINRIMTVTNILRECSASSGRAQNPSFCKAVGNVKHTNIIASIHSTEIGACVPSGNLLPESVGKWN